MADKPLRFCLVTTFYPPFHFGGDGVFVYRLAEALAERGHSVDVIHSVDAYRLQNPVGPEITFSHHPNVTRHALETKNPRLSALSAHQLGSPAVYERQIRGLLDRGRYDVIHYHNISLMGGPGVLRLGRAVKLYTPHEYWLICPMHVLFTFNREACVKRKCIRCTLHSRRPPQLWRYTGLIDRCIREVDCLLAPSRFGMDRLQADGLRCPMTVFPSFVPVPREPIGTEVHPNDGRPFFLFVGRLEKLKGLQDVIPLFAAYEACLLIVGKGDYLQVLREQARGLKNVRFLGQIHPAEISNLYRRAIGVLAPSLCYEVFPLVAAEALAHGTPVIARRIGALAEVIEETGGGCLFDTPQECREAMERLAINPQLRDTLGARGRAAALANWTVEIHLARYVPLAESLISQRASTRGATPDRKSQIEALNR
jgi:glycosyltransferase involved in cell wall biosynthesis